MLEEFFQDLEFKRRDRLKAILLKTNHERGLKEWLFKALPLQLET